MAQYNFEPFEQLCTVEREDHLLFTVDYYGRKQYLIYHIPTKTVLINQSFKLTPKIIKKMITMGIEVAEEAPIGISASVTVH